MEDHKISDHDYFELLYLNNLFMPCRGESPFAYLEDTGKGPTKWGNIDPLWKACGNGKLQSPIDLLNRRVQVFPSLGKLKGDYKPAQAVVKNRGHDISVSCQPATEAILCYPFS